MSTTHTVSLLQWQQTYDLFTEHVDNTHSEPATKWHSTHSILSLPPYQTYQSTKTKDGMEDGLDGKSMGDIGQIYSEALRPGCQKVLEVNACVGFSSILPMDLMARAWETQGKSTVKLPGQAASRC
ncbi:hypothetical protein HO173_006244 [Letharia columbiana]|uniref:Uncharacterized protein n=1 Tax=Letharia columbiana TaxID=112416 RepID=A0A8H6FVN6_9LECA|nr:uncharacterized protein HO173_006244 [Letharia columbiana]KAF6235561.1 hypothetical protein HO173_006244 [Letharia columbiana]